MLLEMGWYVLRGCTKASYPACIVQLQMREMEIQKLAAAAAEARRERDQLRQRAEVSEADADASRAACARVEAECREARRRAQDAWVHLQYAQASGAAPAASAAAAKPPAAQLSPELVQQQELRSSVDSGTAACSVGALALCISPAPAHTAASEDERDVFGNDPELAMHCQVEELQARAGLAEAEAEGFRARAEAAEERCRLAEARCGALTADRKAADDDAQQLRQAASPLKGQLRRMAAALAAAEDRAALAESALAEERERRRASANHAEAAEAAATAEAAMTAQVRALAAQLQTARQEAAVLRAEVQSGRSSAQGDAAAQEGASAALLSANRELEAALGRAGADLEAKMRQLEEARAAVVRLSSENSSLHAALGERDGDAAQHGQAAAAAWHRAETAEAELSRLRADLHSARSRGVELEDALARSGRGSARSGGGGAGAGGPSPLRDVVAALRGELQEKELRLAAAAEDVEAERRRAAELHRQVLDQVGRWGRDCQTLCFGGDTRAHTILCFYVLAGS